MPRPRAINTANRDFKLDTIREICTKQAEKLEVIIEDLSKDHVDDKIVARKLLSKAKSMYKKINAASV